MWGQPILGPGHHVPPAEPAAPILAGCASWAPRPQPPRPAVPHRALNPAWLCRTGGSVPSNRAPSCVSLCHNGHPVPSSCAVPGTELCTAVPYRALSLSQRCHTGCPAPSIHAIPGAQLHPAVPRRARGPSQRCHSVRPAPSSRVTPAARSSVARGPRSPRPRRTARPAPGDRRTGHRRDGSPLPAHLHPHRRPHPGSAAGRAARLPSPVAGRPPLSVPGGGEVRGGAGCGRGPVWR